MTLLDDHELCARLAGEAGDLLLALRVRGGDPAALRADGDRRSHEFLAAELARLRPGDAVLSEEGKDDLARLSAGRVWIVDPLDGTREFGEPGRTDWAVHVALWEAGDLTAGAVVLPARGEVLSTALPPTGGAGGLGGSSPLSNTASPPASPAGPENGQPLRLLVSRSRPPEFVQLMADKLGAELVPLGSAGAKAAAVIRGEAEGYVHAGGQYEWDSAAPVAVARAAGLHASRIDGSKLAYNQASPSLPDILICQAEIAPLLLETIGSVLPGETPG